MRESTGEKKWAEVVGEQTWKAMNNGVSGQLEVSFQIDSLIPEIENGMYTEGKKGRTSYRVYLPRHPLDEPRDPIIVTAENHREVSLGSCETDAEKLIEKWRRELIAFGIEEGFSIVVSQTNICENCKSSTDKRSDCKTCKGRKLNAPTLDDKKSYTKYHYLEFRWKPVKAGSV